MNTTQDIQLGPTGNFDFNQTEMMIDGPKHQIRPVSEQEINRSISQGFGQFFFNALDPNIAKTNIPFKHESEMHIPIIIVSVLMIAGIITGIVMVQFPQLANGGIVLIVVPYPIYLLTAIFCSSIRNYITNLKKFDEYKQIYQKMVTGRGYFVFWIQCYHYKTVQGKNGRTRRVRVVTHTATEKYYPTESVDESGDVAGIKDITNYVFIKYLKRFYFTDKSSEEKFDKAYRAFIGRNYRDSQRTHTHTFEIEGFEEEVGFCMLGDSPHNCLIFYLMAFLGMALPYSCILERSVSRYSINMLKRLTC